jgi:hypothetical protein
MKWNILVGSLVLGLGLSTQSFGMDLLDRMLGTNYNGCSDKSSCCDTPCADPGPSCGCDTGCDVQCVPCKAKCRKTPLLDLLRGCLKCKKSSCDGGCDAGCADPGCADPGCADPGCGVEPACGAEPACGCETVCAPKKCRKTPLLDLLRRHKCKKQSCDGGCADPGCGVEPACGAEPACGCESGCDKCAAKCSVKKRCRVSLLDRIFGCRSCKKQSCSEPACGCEAADPGCGCEAADPGCGCEAGGKAAAPAAAEPTEAEEKDEVGPAPVIDPTAFLPTQRRFIQTNLVR